MLFEWNEVEDAFTNFERASQLSEWMGVIDQISCGVVIGSAWLDLGRIDKAETILSEYDDFIGTKSLYPQIDSELSAFKMNYLACIGNYQEVDFLAKKRSISLEAVEIALGESEFIAFSNSLYMRGNYKNALILSSNLEQSMARLGSTGNQIQLLALMAVCSYHLGEKISAFNIAARAINLAESEGYIRTFVSYGDVMLELLQKLSELTLTNEYRINHTYLGYVISGFMNKYEEEGDLEKTQFGLQYNEAVLPGVLVETLSKREMDVLELIASDQTNSEIADSLYISINTVKSHTSSIYNKLSVSNRLQAVNRARKLGLLD